MRERGLKTNSTAYQILLEISKILGAGSFLCRKMAKTTGIRFLGDRPYLSKHIYDLKRRGYIREIKKNTRKEIELTSKGNLEIIKYKIRLKTEKVKWDGKWRAISWDVPEIARRDRDYLRGKLRWLGFKELQKSIWIFPYKVKDEVKELINLYKKDLSGDVRFFLIEEIEEDTDLKEYFNLF